MSKHDLAGVYVASITPLQQDYSPDVEAIPELMRFFAGRGCHGALLLGTTGEGPSFSPSERIAIFEAATTIKDSHPDFRLLAGTGTPSLDESRLLNRAAFDLGYDGVVMLPPYYFRKASEDGLFNWFRQIIQQSIPLDGALFGYHIPGVSGVALSQDLLARLKDAFPDQFAGIKDSSGDPRHAEQIGERFGTSLTVLTGSDRLLSHALQNHAAGCITAMANFASPQLRIVWDAYQHGEEDPATQTQISAWRSVMENYQPYAPTLKALLSKAYSMPRWPVCPPLADIPEDAADTAYQELFG